ncbi:MAG: DUF6259 domain-containing protein [Victivallales bacterium]
MFTIENGKVRLAFRKDGTLTTLMNLATGHNYAGVRPVWRLYFQRDDEFDCEALPSSTPRIKTGKDSISLAFSSAIHNGKPLAIKVEIKVRISGDESQWSMKVENNEPGIVIRESQFPLIGATNLKEGQELLWSNFGGERISDIRSSIRCQHSQYMASDHLFIGMSTTYPAKKAATNCFLLAGKDEGLYFGCHDKSFEYTSHSLRLYGNDIEAGFIRYPTIKEGGSFSIDTFVLFPYFGSWHVGADKYRRWADSWFKPVTPPEWIRKMNGWQRIIMRHQYGEKYYDYDQLPEIRSDGASAGIDALFMFGWWKGGMDNSNPNYIVDEKLGGERVLIENISRFQRDGGSVILYSNGKLIDVTTDFYKTTGKKISIKDALGVEVLEVYRFRGRGTFYANFRDRSFVTACPHLAEWLELLKGIADTAHRYGCKAVFYDQLGKGDYPCCDESHGHPVPFFAISKQKAEVCRLLREHIKRLDPDMGFGVEWLSDVGAQHVDFIHSLSGFCATSSDWMATGEKPQTWGFVDFFRYMFPEIIMSDREIRDDTDIERRVNHCVLKGLRSDVEIYRCRRTITETPRYQSYLKKANSLRQRQEKFLLNGTYRDTVGFEIDNEEVDGRTYVSGDEMAVVLTQSHLKSTKLSVSVPGYEYVKIDGIGDFKQLIAEGGTASIRLGRHALAVAIFKINR